MYSVLAQQMRLDSHISWKLHEALTQTQADHDSHSCFVTCTCVYFSFVYQLCFQSSFLHAVIVYHAFISRTACCLCLTVWEACVLYSSPLLASYCNWRWAHLTLASFGASVFSSIYTVQSSWQSLVLYKYVWCHNHGIMWRATNNMLIS